MSNCIHPEGCELQRRGKNSDYRILQLRHDKITFGRGPEMSYCLSSTFVSRHHATFYRKDGFWNLTDEKSLNGLFLNGGRVSSGETVCVRRGDLIGFGVPATKTNLDERAFVYKLQCSCVERQLQRVKTENLASPTASLVNPQPVTMNGKEAKIKTEAPSSMDYTLLSSSIIKNLKKNKFNLNLPSTSRASPVCSPLAPPSDNVETKFALPLKRKDASSDVRELNTRTLEKKLAMDCILCGSCHADDQCPQLASALQKIKVEPPTPGWNMIAVPPDSNISTLTPVQKTPGTEIEDLTKALEANYVSIPIFLVTNYVTRNVDLNDQVASNSTSPNDQPNVTDLEERNDFCDAGEASSNEDRDKYNSYSQDDEIICISDDEEYLKPSPSQSKLNGSGMIPIKQEPVDRWYNFNNDQDGVPMDANEDHDDAISREESRPLDLEFALNSESSDDELTVSPYAIPNHTNANGDGPSTSISNYQNKEDEEEPFFPVLSQSFYDGDQSNDRETVDTVSEVVKKSCESSTKHRFYSALLTEPLPLRKSTRTTLEKPKRIPTLADKTRRCIPIDMKPLQKPKRDLKKMIKEQLGNRIPMPGGGSAIVNKIKSPVKSKQTPQASTVSNRVKAQEKDFTVQAKLKRTVNTVATREKSFRFASRGEFLTADLAKSKPTPSTPVVVENSVNSVAPSTNELMDIDCDIDLPMEIETANSESTEAPKRKVRFSDVQETRTIPNLMRKHSRSSEQKDDIEVHGPITKSSVDWQIDDIISIIVSWSPSWLKQQRNMSNPPPLLGNSKLRSTYNCYKSFDDYFDVFKPLLLMETWANITKSFETHDGQLVDHDVAVLQIVPRAPRPNPFVQTVDIICQNLCGQQDIARRQTIQEGYLVILYIKVKPPTPTPEDSTQRQVVFAYVASVERRGYRASANSISTAFDGHVLNKPNGNAQVFTCTLRTKLRAVNMDLTQLMRVKILSYMKPTIRLFQALLNLPKTVMIRDILQPRQRTFTTHPNLLVPFKPKGEFNKAQREAILAIADACCQGSCPKICLLHGPPGTGKSHTIIGLIQQLLYAPDVKSKCGMKPKILLTAASNAAVDELVRRLTKLKHSLPGEKLSFVRVGNTEQVHADVKKYMLDNLVRANVTERFKERSLQTRQTEINLLLASANSTQQKLDYAIVKDEAERVMMFTEKLNSINEQIAMLQNVDGPPSASDNRKLEEKQVRSILEGADVIATTLSSCRQSHMESTFAKTISFTACIVDEATQCIEASTLMPLLYGISKLILVGDPEQLSATVLSRLAQEQGLSQSLFERLYRQFKVEMVDNVVLMLTTQYRMHPEICRFPSKRFYDGKLVTDSAYENKYRNLKFIPYILFNLEQVQEESNNGQVSNLLEIEFIMKLVDVIFKCGANRYSIGIITPYQAQKQKLADALRKKNPDASKAIELNTVDGFQGREKDIIILSTVRAKSETGSIGFLTQEKRLNVALSRARHCCYICGHLPSLNVNTHWRALIYDAKERGHVINVDVDVSPSMLQEYILKPNFP